MLKQQWDVLYENAYEYGIKRIQEIDGVACAFHSVIDGVIHLKPDMIQPLLDAKPDFKRAALEGCEGTIPLEILSQEDFFRGLFFSLSRGYALQRMIRSEAVYEWVLDTFGPGELRLGGTSGNMSRSLAPLGIPITTYANPLTKELAELFGDNGNLRVIVNENNGFTLKTPKEAARESGVFAIHWIFEYTTEFEIQLDDVIIKPRRSNRYIPSWNPRNNQFRMSETFAEGFFSLIDSYSHLLFSGFHILSENYPDGSTCFDVVQPLADYLDRVNKYAPKLKIHLEFASIGSSKIRKAIVENIVPHVHSLGLNETELPLVLEIVENMPDAVEKLDQASIEEYGRAMVYVMNATPLERIHFHNYGYYMCLEREPWHSKEASRDALLFAATMAASRARHGLFSSLDDIKKGLHEPVGDEGIEAITQLSNTLNQPSLLTEGIGAWDGYVLTAIPTKLVRNPLFTVGLGDTISSGAFLVE